MPLTREIGLAFACGVLVTVGVLHATADPAPDAATQLYAPAAVRPALAVTPAPARLPAPLAVPEADAMYGTDMEDFEEEAIYAPAPLDTPTPSGGLFGAAGLAAVAVAGLVGYAWRRATRGAPAELDTLVVLPQDIAIAPLLGRKRLLSKDRQDMLASPWSERRKFMAAGLSKELRAEHGVRSMVVRAGDEVRVIGGDWKGKTGKVTASDITKLRVFIEGVEHKKNNGKTVQLGLHPCQVEITTLKMDEDRKAILERRAKGRTELAEQRVKWQSEPLPAKA